MAEFPSDLRYTTDHEWVAVQDSIARVGITQYATEALSDVVFASLPTAGTQVQAGDSVAELESTKSVSEVYAPVTGVVCHINDAASDNPEIINEDPYGEGWLFEIEMTNPDELESMLTAAAYIEQLT
jgi:glycine cleavage system H protein